MEKVQVAIFTLSHLIVFLIGLVAAFALLQYYPQVQNAAGLTNLETSLTLTASAPILAVRADTNEGVIGTVNVEIAPGKGRILVNTNPFVEPDTQQSAETAAGIASKLSGVSLNDRDVIITFDSGSNLVGGPSAGAAMTLALYSALENKTIKQDIAITGTIETSGKIGWIGGILQKMEAAAKIGKRLFLVPKGQEVLSYYEPQQTREQRGSLTIIRTTYVAKQINLNQYAQDQQLNIRVQPVANITEAIPYALSD